MLAAAVIDRRRRVHRDADDDDDDRDAGTNRRRIVIVIFVFIIVIVVLVVVFVVIVVVVVVVVGLDVGSARVLREEASRAAAARVGRRLDDAGRGAGRVHAGQDVQAVPVVLRPAVERVRRLRRARRRPLGASKRARRGEIDSF